jgi:hypothetical protein
MEAASNTASLSNQAARKYALEPARITPEAVLLFRQLLARVARGADGSCFASLGIKPSAIAFKRRYGEGMNR